MDPALSKAIDNEVPKLNPELANGYAASKMTGAAAYVDALVKSVAKYFPPNLAYLGCRYCTPVEEFLQSTNRKPNPATNRNQCTYEMSRYDVRMLMLMFRYTGTDRKTEDFTKCINIPFINHSGTTHIKGVRYTINPVIWDRSISVSQKEVFVRLNIDKISFKSFLSKYMVGDKVEIANVVWAHVYKPSAIKQSAIYKAHTTMMHYLLAKYGYTEAFMKAIQCVPVVGYNEINEENYPADKWVICSSMGLRPTKLKLDKSVAYVPTQIRLAVPIEKYTREMKQYIAAFFYIVDFWPRRMLVDQLNSLHVWRQSLGELIFGDTTNLGKHESNIEKHLGSIENYIDSVAREQFREDGVNASDIYELFALVCDNYDNWTIGQVSEMSNMYNRQLDIYTTALKDIREGINLFYLNLLNKMNKKGPILALEEIKKQMNSNIKLFAINKLSNTTNHPEVSTLDSSTDCKAFKTTLQVIPQEAMSNRGGKGRVSYDNPDKYLHASIAEVNAYLSINKVDPTGHNRLNPCLNVDKRGRIIRHPDLIELLDRTQRDISRDSSQS